MNLLAIDTSTKYLSLAVTDGIKVLGRIHRKADMMHSTLLVPMIDKLLKKTRTKLKSIDCFVVSIGPGSFTGLRISVATVKGLAYVTKKPIVTVPTLDVIAENAKGFKGVICPVLDARKNKVYSCIYKSDGKVIKRISKYLLEPLEDLKKRVERYKDIIFLGDAVEKGLIYRSPTSYGSRTSFWYPKADIAARMGLEYFRKKRFVKAEDLEPLYLYSRECDIKGK